ncbi:MAG: arginine--tRNA ligase [Saprospiraceae bacterium]
MKITDIIQQGVAQGVQQLYGVEVAADKVTLQPTRREFTGDYTVVVFPYTRAARKKPEMIGAELGAYLQENVEQVAGFNVIKGFLNLEISNSYWNQFLHAVLAEADYGQLPAKEQKVMVEFCSPNTNKPLHLGHIRNILLGWSTAQILAKAGYEVIKTQIINDRGIAICRSMLAWQRFGIGETPENTGLKGDHFVGKYYVKFAQEFKAEYADWQKTTAADKVFAANKKADQTQEDFFKDYQNQYFNNESVLGNEAKDMLLKWEAGDPHIRQLWAMMNSWVYKGFGETFETLGVSFDQLYYESDTYLLGKEIIEEGLEKGILTQEDKRVFIELDNIGLGRKTIIKSDGTSTYTSQDLGTADVRYRDFGTEKMIYVVGDEQIAHFQGVFEILKRLGKSYAEGLYHLAYGMVELPTGKMKSREGTVVDADDLMAKVIEEARAKAMELDNIKELPKAEQDETVRKIGLAALKYFIIKVSPQKWMTFDPQESVQLTGQTGPYIQYSYVRIKKLVARGTAEGVDFDLSKSYLQLESLEKELIQQIYQFPNVIEQAAAEYEPSAIANYCYDLAKTFAKFYHDHPIFGQEAATVAFRLQLSQAVGHVIESGMELLGIEMPEQM